jgi:hypothetical protein
MEERATKRGGADIYLARTTMNYFKTAVASECNGSQIVRKPIYLISGGAYTPFKGAMTAGAEYNSIKDSELAPNSFWYKVTVEENPTAEGKERPYIVRVNPIQYVAHQVNYQGTDKLVAGIENQIQSTTDELVQGFVDTFSTEIVEPRTAGRKKIREILIANRSVARENASIAEYLQEKNGKKKPAKSKAGKVEDLGANVPKSEGKTIVIGLDNDLELDK